MNPPEKIVKTQGITNAERYLQTLCDRSFLSLWSYAGVCRDQGETGKEICDLLVAFDEHIIIFSDKDCEFPDTGNLELDWKRWYRKAIRKSAEQVWGAERWLLSHPDRVFLDRSCTVPFPFELPSADKAKVHRIVVAHSASERCRKELNGGSGSLLVVAHKQELADLCIPFTIGQVDPSKGFVHVFDDTTLKIVLDTLDTISDFVDYLTKKAEVLTDGTVIQAAGEEELLAFYMLGVDKESKAAFAFKNSMPGVSHISLAEGFWEKYSRSSHRKKQIEANKISYEWDALIEKFSRHALDGTSYYNHPEGIGNQERLLRFMARESRLRRRMLSEMLLGIIRKTRRYERATRTVKPSRFGEPYYIFLLFPQLESLSYQDYRKIRMNLLENHCLLTKLHFPDAQDVIGIATESGRTGLGSEDAVHFDARDWDEERERDVKRIKFEMIERGMLGEYRKGKDFIKDYPQEVKSVINSFSKKDFVNMKGRSRNLSCPCGSGKKYKKCHGNQNL